MNYPATNYPYHVGGEVDGYAPSCDFLYPFVDLKPTATAFQHSWAPSHSGATYNVASFGEERPPTGSSSMSTPQLTASSGRGASCSPLSTYDETPSPRVDSIDYATVSGGTEVYTAPATIFDWECANAHGTQYGNPALNGAASLGHPTHPEYNPEYWSFQGAALQNCSSSSAPTWPQEPYNMPMQGFGQPLTEAESQSYWAAACGQAHPSAEPLQHIAEPSSFASSFGAHASQPTTATGAAELHHPRPQRGWLLAWQTAVDFDADEFLASLSRKSTSPANPPQPTCENDSFAMDEDVGSETEEDELSYPDCDDSEEMEADWQIEGNASPGSIERPDLFFDSNGWSGASSAASAEVDIGQGIGLGFSTRTLGPDSILCQPVFFSGQPDPSWMQPEDAAEHHQLSTLSPSFP